jgi:drug/metabolite transporter (DMT)-like permease
VTRRSWILLAVLAALWGASYAFIKVALDEVSPAFLVVVRVALGALVLAPVALARGALGPAGRHLPWLAFVAVAQVDIPFLLIAVGEQSIPSSLAGILVASAGMFTALLAVGLLPGDRLSRTGLSGVLCALVGVTLLFGVDLGGGGTDAIVGGLLVLLASVGYAVGSLAAKRHLAEVPPIGVAAGIMLIGTVLLAPVVPFSLPDAAPGADTWGALAVLGAGGTGLAFLIFFTLNAEIGPSRASIVSYVAPVFSVVYGVALLDEGFSIGTAAGLVLILLGSWTAANDRPPWRARARVPAGAAAA